MRLSLCERPGTAALLKINRFAAHLRRSTLPSYPTVYCAFGRYSIAAVGHHKLLKSASLESFYRTARVAVTMPLRISKLVLSAALVAAMLTTPAFAGGALAGLGEALGNIGRQNQQHDDQLELMQRQHDLEMQRIKRESDLNQEALRRQAALDRANQAAAESKLRADQAQARADASAIETLNAIHPGWRALVLSKPFTAWEEKNLNAAQRRELDASKDPNVVSGYLWQYKNSLRR